LPHAAVAAVRSIAVNRAIALRGMADSGAVRVGVVTCSDVARTFSQRTYGPHS
jgi:hypothetical protein